MFGLSCWPWTADCCQQWVVSTFSLRLIIILLYCCQTNLLTVNVSLHQIKIVINGLLICVCTCLMQIYHKHKFVSVVFIVNQFKTTGLRSFLRYISFKSFWVINIYFHSHLCLHFIISNTLQYCVMYLNKCSIYNWLSTQSVVFSKMFSW